MLPVEGSKRVQAPRSVRFRGAGRADWITAMGWERIAGCHPEAGEAGALITHPSVRPSKRIFDINAEIANPALGVGVAEKQLDRSHRRRRLMQCDFGARAEVTSG
jgi:hypothetical protein